MIVINVVLVNVKTLLVMFCIMSPSCLQFSTLALPHHACHKEGLEENTLKRQSWISNFEKWWKWKVQNKFRNYISIRLPLLRPRSGPTFISQRCQRCQALQHRRERGEPTTICSMQPWFRDNYNLEFKIISMNERYPSTMAVTILITIQSSLPQWKHA